MAKGFSDTHSLAVWNGYGEIPSPELQHRYIKPHHGELYPQYPPLFTILALPFYRVFGFFGLFVLNSLAFVGVVWLTFLTARRLFKDVDLALNSCLIMILATFAWEYSQAAWPHIFALLFIMAAFYFSLRAYEADTTGEAVMQSLACGFVGAAGLGVRLDNVLFFPALVLPFLFANPPRAREALAVVMGSTPPLIGLAAMNYARFGDFNPLSYGDGSVQTISSGIVVAVAVLVLIAWVVTRPRFGRLPTYHRALCYGVLGSVLLLNLILAPYVGDVVFRVLRDGYVCTVDVRALPADSLVAPRSSGGGVLYIGAHKKALLQSIPYLPLLVLPALSAIGGCRERRELVTLFLPVMVVIAFYAYSFPIHDMGGLCLNTRYFTPCLPFFSMLLAYGVKDLKARWEAPPPMVACVACSLAVAGAFFLSIGKLYVGVDALEFPLLVIPLYAALLISILVAGGILITSHWVRLVRHAAWMALVGAMTWAGLVAFCYDYPAHRFVRMVQSIYGQKLLESISPDSIVFADNKTFTVVMNAIEKPRARVAFPLADQFEDFTRLLDFQLRAGRRAYAFFHDSTWNKVRVDFLASRRITPLVAFDGFTLAEIAAAEKPK